MATLAIVAARCKAVCVVAVVMGVSVVDRLLMRMRIATGMPSGMHDRALLREEQQSNAEIVENPPGHYLGKDAEAAGV